MPRSRRTWTVREGEEALRSVFDRSGADAEAIQQGRVFINARRAAHPDMPVLPGDRVDVYPPLTVTGRVRILCQRGEWVAVEKPPGVVTEPDHHGGFDSVLHQASRALGCSVDSLHAVSRLDRAVSGVVLLRLKSASNRRASPPLASDRFLKLYVAIACGAPTDPCGSFRAKVTAKAGRSRPALTHYRIIGRARANGLGALLELSLGTGHKHQIRQHTAQAGIPLLGDPRYGGERRVSLPGGRIVTVSRIMLHAFSIHTENGPDGFRATCPVPADMFSVWRQLGGSAADFERAGNGPKVERA